MAVIGKSKKKVETSKFHRFFSILTKVLLVPVLIIASFSVYIFYTTKQNNGIPTGFNKCVITILEDIDTFSQGQDVLVDKVNPRNIQENNYVAYYKPISEEEVEDEGSPIAFKKVLNISDIEEEWTFDFGEGDIVGEENIIGLYSGSGNEFVIMAIRGFSSTLSIILSTIVPLGVLLLLLVFDIIEQVSIQKAGSEVIKSTSELRAKFNRGQSATNEPYDAAKTFAMGQAKSQVLPPQPKRPLPQRPNTLPPKPPGQPSKSFSSLPPRPNSSLPPKPPKN